MEGGGPTAVKAWVYEQIRTNNYTPKHWIRAEDRFLQRIIPDTLIYPSRIRHSRSFVPRSVVLL